MNIYIAHPSDTKRTEFFVGQTGRSYQERHKDRDYGKLTDIIKARGAEFEIIGWFENVDIEDHKIHAWLKKQPGWRNVNELFWTDNPGYSLDYAVEIIKEEFFSEVSTNKPSIQLRDYQHEFVAKAQADYLEFLLAAKCRAGKSVMTLSHIKDKGHKVSLIVSRFCSPVQSWREDLIQYNDFDNFAFVSLDDNNWQQQLTNWMGTDRQIVIWSTVQGLVKKLERLSFLTDIDLLVFDEAHIGDKANQFLNIRENLSQTPCLKVSGTAYDQLWDTTENNRFVYDYFQEQVDVKEGKFHRPKMNVILAKYESDKYAQIYGDDPDAMKNLFLIENGEFKNESLVKDFIQKYFAITREIRPQHRLLKDANHIYMCLPSVEACHLFQKMIDNVIPAIVVTGDTKNNVDDINKFVCAHNRSICLTYCANVLGVTQSKWDTIINAREGKSVQFWTQFAFRGGSGEHDWKVIDFVPTRALQSLRETFALSSDLSPIPSEYKFTDFVPIHEWDNGFSECSIERVNEILSAEIGNVSQLMTGGTEGINTSLLNQIDFKKYLEMDVEISKLIQLNDEANNGKGAKKRVNEKNKGEKNDLQRKINTIKSYLAIVPQVIFNELRNNNRVQNIWDVFNSPSYSIMTGDGDNLLPRLVNDAILSSRALSNRVSLVATSVDYSMKQNLTQTVFDLGISGSTQKGIPPELFQSMIGL